MAIEKRPPPGKPAIDRTADEAEVVPGHAATPAAPVGPGPGPSPSPQGGPVEMGDPEYGGEEQPAPSTVEIPELKPSVYVAYKVFYPNKSPREDATVLEGIYDLDTRAHLDAVITRCKAYPSNEGCTRLVILFWRSLRA